MNKQSIVEWIKKNERQAKVFIIGFYGFVMLLMFASYPRDFSSFYNERELSQTKSNYKTGNVCQIEDYKLYKFEEPLIVPFWQVFINGFYGLYRVYDIMYVNKSGEKSKFFTYKCPLTYGLDVVPEDVHFVIEESYRQCGIFGKILGKCPDVGIFHRDSEIGFSRHTLKQILDQIRFRL